MILLGPTWSVGEITGSREESSHFILDGGANKVGKRTWPLEESSHLIWDGGACRTGKIVHFLLGDSALGMEPTAVVAGFFALCDLT